MTGKPGHILDNNLSNKINKKDTKIKFLFEINTVSHILSQGCKLRVGERRKIYSKISEDIFLMTSLSRLAGILYRILGVFLCPGWGLGGENESTSCTVKNNPIV
jgi:hypothetical protein